MLMSLQLFAASAIGFLLGLITAWFVGIKPDEHLPTIPHAHRLDSTARVFVDPSYKWIPISDTTPRHVKLQLLGLGGCAVYATYNGADFWTHWAPLPTKASEVVA